MYRFFIIKIISIGNILVREVCSYHSLKYYVNCVITICVMKSSEKKLKTMNNTREEGT